MQKQIGIFISMFLLVACAGMPPAWWNPRGATAGTVATDTNTKAPATQQIQTPRESVEFDLSLQDETYEEMTITPLQDEEDENVSGDASAQSVVPLEDDLPAPSILEE